MRNSNCIYYKAYSIMYRRKEVTICMGQKESSDKFIPKGWVVGQLDIGHFLCDIYRLLKGRSGKKSHPSSHDRAIANELNPLGVYIR